MSDTTLWAELLAYGTGIGLSPIHIAVLLLLLLGPNPIKRGGWFVAIVGLPSSRSTRA